MRSWSFRGKKHTHTLHIYPKTFTLFTSWSLFFKTLDLCLNYSWESPPLKWWWGGFSRCVSHLSCWSSPCPSEVRSTAGQEDKTLVPVWPVSPSANPPAPEEHILSASVSTYLNLQPCPVLSPGNAVLKHSIWNISCSMSPYVEQARQERGFLSVGKEERSQGFLSNHICLLQLWCRNIRESFIECIFMLLLLNSM